MEKPRISRRGLFYLLGIFIGLPTIIIYGVINGDRSYLFISTIIVIIAMYPFFSLFEKRKPSAREIVPIAVMATIAAVGRFAFAMVPQFKPVSAIVIITGMSFGSEAGFLTGALSALISNFFFGQGPWTPWQMFAFGVIGFLSGKLNKWGVIKTRSSICVWGFLSAYIYGIIVNMWHLTSYATEINLQAIIVTYSSSFIFDTIHAFSTVIFLFILSNPMMEKMIRVRKKYGIYRNN